MQQIILQNIHPTFLSAEAVADSDIWNKEVKFTKGERIQIVAPSGSGKTSLIHFLYGMRNDYNGNILFDEKKWKDFSRDEKASVRTNKLSVIFQDLRLFPDHTAFENIEVKRKLQPYDGAREIKETAAILGIKNKMEQSAGTCSYGEQQRIAIARALQQPFDFLLLDEPFSHLDEKNRSIAMKLMEEEATKRGAAIILADLMPIAYFKADRTLRL